MMTEEEKKAYALYLIKTQVLDFEHLTTFEAYAEYAGAPEDELADISDADADEVTDLVRSAKIEVSW
jgi:hypothetical protein